MSCEEYSQLLTGYIDGELTSEQRDRVEAHLKDCETCKRTFDEFVAMKEQLNMIKFKEHSDVELERYWSSIYNRLERGLAWILFSLGSIVLLCYGAFKLIEEMISDPSISLIVKIGVVSLIFGGVALFVSLFRERLTVRKTDKYSQEVQR